MAIWSPKEALAGRLMVCAALVVSIKYPLPADAVLNVEPSAVITDCQLTSTPTDEEPPSDIEVPLIVIVELESLALAIEPDNISFVTEVFGNVTVLEDKSCVEFNLSAGIVPDISTFCIVPSSIFVSSTEPVPNAFLGNFVNAI